MGSPLTCPPPVPRTYLDLDVTLSPEAFQAHAAVVAQHLNRGLQLLIRLFLVEDLVDSLEVRSLPPPPHPPPPLGAPEIPTRTPPKPLLCPPSSP